MESSLTVSPGAQAPRLEVLLLLLLSLEVTVCCCPCICAGAPLCTALVSDGISCSVSFPFLGFVDTLSSEVSWRWPPGQGSRILIARNWAKAKNSCSPYLGCLFL